MADITTSKGAKISFEYVPMAEHLKAGYVCDHLYAYENSKKVGYLKIDRIDEKLFKKECPDIWAYLQEYQGRHLFSDTSQPISEKPFSELVKALRSGYMHRHVGYWAKEMKWLPDDISIISAITDQYNTDPSEWEKYDQLVRKFFTEWVKSYDGKQAVKKRKQTIQHAIKPFVAYISSQENKHQGLDADNRGRGIGMALYLEGAKWLKERGLAKGLYASSLQSDEAKSMWKKMEQQGLVVSDGDRKYVNG